MLAALAVGIISERWKTPKKILLSACNEEVFMKSINQKHDELCAELPEKFRLNLKRILGLYEEAREFMLDNYKKSRFAGICNRVARI